ncbi:hypothetical protein SAMN02745148_01054 [Modicisalibacter ilicicola DSM 19980]|uniref:Uncharacterized protein n=1 Tax=Modicisalibacter ilicicola DSM 19980 TaxID=1121942 RepID=A0A1M4W3J5_9GAMM|nr:hypothetical protein [Halomonas ilicicola]SHE75522.1 hypothetical protein SAMN02745148_01054 [Halomonas ilicicola DSM 19980]
MKTYFIRHSSELDIDRVTLETMWKNQFAGIHYPHDKAGNFGEGDSISTDPRDYKGRGKSSLDILWTIARDGGYVCTTYRGIPGAKLGIVRPGSEVQLLRGTWGSKNGLKGREAVLKVLQLENVINLSAIASLPLTTVQPRQGTICQWRKVKKRVQAVLEGEPSKDVSNLTPDLQEVMCMEFMRTSAAAAAGLPKLQSTLAPIGRTMPDVDIYGISTTGQPIVAQVTYHTLDAATGAGKLSKLDAYAKDGASTILFCLCKEPTEAGGHLVFPLTKVFQEFCIDSVEGKAWLAAVSA